MITHRTLGDITGTHIDAPSHFLQNGKTIDQLPIEKLIGRVLVMAFEDDVQVINEKSLISHP
ncbi:MAG: cyclase family protein, partial [Pirellulaceae bacterium]